MNNKYIFTIDDNIRFLQEATEQKLSSVFSHSYLQLLKNMNEKYGTKFQLNMYYSYEPGGFSLCDVSDEWIDEFESNANWLRFSFHARNNDPPFPYEGDGSKNLLADYQIVFTELKRIAGKAATNETTTIHYVCATEKACKELSSIGVKGLIGMFLPKEDNTALRYYLDADEASRVFSKRLWKDDRTGLTFLCNNLVINTVNLDEIEPILDKSENKELYHVMIHEQYYYKDYVDYQPDFAEKIETTIKWLIKNECESAFFEDLIV